MAKRYLTKIGMFSLGKITGAIYALIGFVLGAIITHTALLSGSMRANVGGIAGILFGIWAIVAFPILYGIIGFIGGIITAFIFNVATRFLGGLEIEVE